MAAAVLIGLYGVATALVLAIYSRVTFTPPGSLPSPVESVEQRASPRSPAGPDTDLRSIVESPAANRSPSASAPSSDSPAGGTEGVSHPPGNGTGSPASGSLVLSRGYRWTNLYLLPLALPVLLGLLGGWAVLFGYVADLLVRTPSTLLLVNQGISVARFAGAWVGILWFPLVMDRITRLILGRRRYHEYNQFHMNRLGEDIRPGLFRLVGLLTLVLSVALVLGMDWYTRFEEERIVVNRLWGFGEVSYPYSRVRAVVLATHSRGLFGQVFRRKQPCFTLVFDDGQQWNVDFASSDQYDEKAIAELVLRKTGKRAVPARLPEDVVGR